MQETEPSTELLSPDEIGLERLQRRPVIDRIEPRQLELIKRTIAVAEGDQAITDAEIGYFLELCAAYGLDPFAREAWIAKSKTGKLLIMVGRDGLRKIVVRQRLEMRSAVVYAKDQFMVTYVDNPADAKDGEWEAHGCAPFHRVKHERTGIGEARGPILGAWARVRDPRTNVEKGYFDAPISEYMPANVSQYSPWSKQTSVMMAGAVERQAAKQATPLGGFLLEGEDESANAARTVGAGEGSGEGPGWGDMPEPLVRDVETLIEEAKRLGHAGLSDVATVQVRLHGQSEDVVREWIKGAVGELNKLEPPEAEVVE